MRRILYERMDVVAGVVAMVVVLGATAVLAVPGSIRSSFDRLSGLGSSALAAGKQAQSAVLQPNTGETFAEEGFSLPTFEAGEEPPTADQVANDSDGERISTPPAGIQTIRFAHDDSVTRSGTVGQLKYSPSGNLDGFYFAEDGTAVNFPPGYDVVSGAVSEGSEVEVSGVMRTDVLGESVFEARTLTNPDNGNSIHFERASRQTAPQVLPAERFEEPTVPITLAPPGTGFGPPAPTSPGYASSMAPPPGGPTGT